MILVSQSVERAATSASDDAARATSLTLVEFGRRQPVGTKADAVFFALREQLIAGERPYGETLSTNELAQEFGVSRRPVMDAMMRLEVAGFIEIIRQVGCRVVVPERRMVREHFYAAGVLDGAAARLAASRASEAERELLRQALRGSRSAARAFDKPRFEVANKRFHTALLTAGGNRRLADLAHSSWDLSDFYLQRRTPDDLRRSHREHEAIAEAIARRDPEGARDAAEAHLARFGEAPILPDDDPES
jgi:DNA-binding GntR family transcriptional regulator